MLAKTKITGLIMALMALSAPLVWADEGGAGDKDSSHQEGDWHHGQGDHMMGPILNLSEDQEKQIKDNQQKDNDARKGVFEQMKANREALDAEIVKATPDMNKINEFQTQLKTIQSQMADSRLNSLLAIKKILTPEQFAGYMALKKERELMMREHHQWGHHGEFGKEGDEQRHGGDKADKDDDSDKD